MNILIDHIKNRVIEQDQHQLIVVCGRPGGGKSSAAVRLAELLDPNFSSRNIVFEPDDFLNLLNDKNLKPGSVILWDEIGVELYSRNFFTEQNKKINHAFQTCRYKNFIIIVTTPSLKLLDTHTRGLMQIYIETRRIDYKNKKCKVKWMNITQNPRIDKTYFKYNRIVEDSTFYTVKDVNIKKPSYEIWRSYLRKATKYKDKLNIDSQMAIAHSRRLERRQKMTIPNEDIIREIMRDKQLYFNRLGRINAALIRSRFDIGKPRADSIKAEVEARLNI